MQLLMNDIVINDIIGKFPLAFRPPFMEMNYTVLSQLETMGYIPITASVDSKDSSAQSKPYRKLYPYLKVEELYL
ncbi:hypothetical protein HMI54_014061 [Coelomomyces lativittatus]|nr:hypothetical protein HMI54_014061 [Coelomomyces lativittatus]